MNKLKNKIKRIKDEIRIIFKLSMKINFISCIIIAYAKIINYIVNKKGTQESSFQTKVLQRKHLYITRYLTKTNGDFYTNYKYVPKKDNKNMENTIWVCWWQGLDNAPDLVKTCINSIKRTFKNYNIIIIDDNNYKQYVKIPSWLEKKKNEGKISKTHFSDFLRVELLAEHGGIWLDSTFYCVNEYNNDFLKSNIWTIRRPDYGHLSPACGNFANYALGCRYDNRKLFEILSDYILDYWKKNDFVIDYLLTDYLLNIVLSTNPDLMDLVKSINPNNEHCDDLFKVLGKKYDEKIWNILKNNTYLFKLSWKHSFEMKTKDNEDTFYLKLMNDELK